MRAARVGRAAERVRVVVEVADPPPAVVTVFIDGDPAPALTVVCDDAFEAVQLGVHYGRGRLHPPTKECLMPQTRTIVSHHLFRRTARSQKTRIEKLQASARGPLEERRSAAAFRELKDLKVGRFDMITVEKPARGFRWQVVASSRS